jgi:hypothetical protein
MRNILTALLAVALASGIAATANAAPKTRTVTTYYYYYVNADAPSEVARRQANAKGNLAAVALVVLGRVERLGARRMVAPDGP